MGRFQYQQRGNDQWKNRATQQTGLYDSIFFERFSTFKPKEGDHTIRLLPPTWDPPHQHYGIEIYVHYGVGPDNQTYLCAKAMGVGDCPICEERKIAEKANDLDYVKELAFTKRCLVWVINRANEDDGPVLWGMPITVDKEICRLAQDRQTGQYLSLDHVEEGYDIDFTREGSSLKTKYVGVQVARRDTVLSHVAEKMDDWLDYIVKNPLPEVLQFFDSSHISGMFTGSEEVQRPQGPESPRTRQEASQPRSQYEEPARDAPPPRRTEEDDIPFNTGAQQSVAVPAPAPRRRLETRPSITQSPAPEQETEEAPTDFRSRFARSFRK